MWRDVQLRAVSRDSGTFFLCEFKSCDGNRETMKRVAVKIAILARDVELYPRVEPDCVGTPIFRASLRPKMYLSSFKCFPHTIGFQ